MRILNLCDAKRNGKQMIRGSLLLILLENETIIAEKGQDKGPNIFQRDKALLLEF